MASGGGKIAASLALAAFRARQADEPLWKFLP
jgi:hypothetical protein